MTKEADKTSWYQKWQEGQWSRNPGIATGMLLIFLLLTVLAAQMLVWKHEGQSGERSRQNEDLRLRIREGRRRGGQIVEQICRVGLSSDRYLGREGQVHYYLVRESGKPTGFSGYSLQPRLASSGITFSGKEMRLDLSGRYRLQTECEFSEDLSKYRYTQHILGNRGGITVHQLYADGVLRVFLPRRPVQSLRVESVLESPCLIPPFLLDFFSSVAAQQETAGEISLTVVQPSENPRNPTGLDWLDCLVRPGGEIPKAIAEKTPEGLAIETLWPERLIYGEPHVQTVYYNRQHQLVWQEDSQFGETIEMVTRDELAQENPEAFETLESWLKTEAHETDSTWL